GPGGPGLQLLAAGPEDERRPQCLPQKSKGQSLTSSRRAWHAPAQTVSRTGVVCSPGRPIAPACKKWFGVCTASLIQRKGFVTISILLQVQLAASIPSSEMEPENPRRLQHPE